MNDHTVKALHILLNNRYLSLATQGQGGPWIAPLAYVIDQEMRLIYYSATEARHSIDLRREGKAACAIFDSTASSDAADGLQFTARVEEIPEAELSATMDYYFTKSFPDAEVRARWSRPVSDFTGQAPQRFYRITIVELFKPDTESIKVDRRLRIDVEAMKRLFAS